MSSFLWLTVFFAISDWLAVWRNQQRARYLTKPATLLALIIWYTQMGGWQPLRLWFGLGLVFSLAGDVFLLLPPRFFLTGLAAFLTAHLWYIIGFNQSLPYLNGAVLLIALTIIILALYILRNVRRGLETHEHRNLIPAVMLYGAVISLMLLSAVTCLWRPDWSITPALLASLGAGFFFLSDTLLVQNRFVSPIPQGNLWVMICYHLGQMLLAIAAILR